MIKKVSKFLVFFLPLVTTNPALKPRRAKPAATAAWLAALPVFGNWALLV